MAVSKFLPEFPNGDEGTYDVVIVSGDAYVDHPSFGAAVIGRFLEAKGFKVGIIAQPDWKSPVDFMRFGKPRLFFGVTAGNMDSMVANYSPNRIRRDTDSYSPGGVAGKRPDLATIVYAQRLKSTYPDALVVLGGIEASLRRIAHYDYIQQKIRGSVLADAKADYLVYGMGERAILDLARSLKEGATPEELRKIRGLAYLSEHQPQSDDAVILPSVEECVEPPKFYEAFEAFNKAGLLPHPPVIAQSQAGRWITINPPAKPLTPSELDAVYQLPFARAYPPRYEEMGGIPALNTVRWSIVTHRGCYGGCSFCALGAHQGKGIVSRPKDGILIEIERMAALPGFGGTVTDLGGPTANMYATGCSLSPAGMTACDRQSCLTPNICKNLDVNGSAYLELLRAARKVKGVKNVFVASGIRHDLLVTSPQRRLMRELVEKHVGGQMKVAPEHVSTRVLKLMGKPPQPVFKDFARQFKKMAAESGKELHFIPYLITGHPGTTMEDAVDLAKFAKKLGHFVEQVQTFTPTPSTVSTCMFYTRRDPVSGETVFVPSLSEAVAQRAMVQIEDPANREKLASFLVRAGREDLLKEFGLKPPTTAPKRERSGPPRSADDRPRGDRPRPDRASSDHPRGDKPRNDRPRADGPRSDRPSSDRPRSDRPRPNRAAGERTDRKPREGGSFDRKPREGGFERKPREGGSFDRKPREGGFERKPREGGSFDRKPREGGFERKPREGGSFERKPREGGFDRKPREGGSFERKPREGGFERKPREGGFERKPREGGSFERKPREGGSFERKPREGASDRKPREGSERTFDKRRNADNNKSVKFDQKNGRTTDERRKKNPEDAPGAGHDNRPARKRRKPDGGSDQGD